LRNPEKKISLIERELESLKEEQDVINKQYKEIQPQYKYAEKLPYEKAVKLTLDKLERQKRSVHNRIDNIRALAGLQPVAKT
jgi:hypothetical protein